MGRDAWPTRFGMSDVWSTMARRLRRGRGPAPDGRRPRRARAGRPGQRRRRSRSRTARAASSSGRTCAARRRRCCATARATSARVWTSPCACGRERAAHPHRRPPRRHAARAGGERLPAGDRRASSAADARLGRHCVVAEGDPIVPPLRVYVEAPRGGRPRRARAASCTRRCGARFAVDPARAGLAAGGRAQDPHRPPDRARRRAAATRSRTSGGRARHDRHHRRARRRPARHAGTARRAATPGTSTR